MTDKNYSLDFLANDAAVVARKLIGWKLYSKVDGVQCGGTIIETEAYGQFDAASHSFNGQTNRNAVMFGSAGYVYVYFTYGMHWCMNIVTGKDGVGEAVLIRAILPEEGLETMRQRRNGIADAKLTDGPAKLCQALGVNGEHNGARIDGELFSLEPPTVSFKVKSTPRIGIQKEKDALLRFVAE